MSEFSSAEWVLIITTVFTGIVSVIGAWKTATGNRLTQEVKDKTDEAKHKANIQEIKLDDIHSVTNSSLTEVIKEKNKLEEENMRLRADLIALGANRRKDVGNG